MTDLENGLYAVMDGEMWRLDVKNIPPKGKTYWIGGKPTNADRIRRMSDEELANQLMFLFVAYDFRNPVDLLEWLKKEVEE